MKTEKLIQLLDEIESNIENDFYSSAISKARQAKQLLQEVTPTGIQSYQLCPKCNGEGRLNNNGVTTSVFRQCDVCNGDKTLPIYTSQFHPTVNGCSKEQREAIVQIFERTIFRVNQNPKHKDDLIHISINALEKLTPLNTKNKQIADNPKFITGCQDNSNTKDDMVVNFVDSETKEIISSTKDDVAVEYHCRECGVEITLKYGFCTSNCRHKHQSTD